MVRLCIMVGPATAMLQPNGNGSLLVSLASGRLLVSSTKPGSSVELELDDEKCILGFLIFVRGYQQIYIAVVHISARRLLGA